MFLLESDELKPCPWFKKTYLSVKSALSAMAGDDGHRQGSDLWDIEEKDTKVWVVKKKGSLQEYYLIDVLALARMHLVVHNIVTL